MLGSKKWTKEEIQSLLETNDEMVRVGLLAVYALQTQDEKNSEHTKHNNGVGFNGRESEILSSFANQLKDKGYLSPKQIDLARKKLMKYAGQMIKVANGDIEVDENDLRYKR